MGRWVRRACCSHSSDVTQPAVVQTTKTPTTNTEVRMLEAPSLEAVMVALITHSLIFCILVEKLLHCTYSPGDDPPSYFELDIIIVLCALLFTEYGNRTVKLIL